MKESYENRRNILCEGLNQIKGFSCDVPGGAFFVFANLSEFGLGSKEFCLKLLDETKAVTVPGLGFGQSTGKLNLDNYFRISYATSEEDILEFLNHLEGFSNKFFKK